MVFSYRCCSCPDALCTRLLKQFEVKDGLCPIEYNLSLSIERDGKPVDGYVTYCSKRVRLSE